MQNKIIKKKAQSSTELIIIISIFLLVFGSIFYFSQSYLLDSTTTHGINMVKNSLQDVVNEIENVYQQGAGASSKVLVYLPDSVNFAEVNNSIIKYTLDNGKVIYKNTNIPVIGEMPTTGPTWVYLESSEGYVFVYYDLFEVNPNSIHRSLFETNTTLETFTIRNLIDEFIDFNITYVGNTGINLTLLDSTLSIPGKSIDSFYLNITIPENASYGRYKGILKIDALSNDTKLVGNKTIPITIDVNYNESAALQAVIGILPNVWNINPAYSNYEQNNRFYAYSGFNTAKNLSLNISGPAGDWVSFSPWNTTQTTELNISILPEYYDHFLVYVKPKNNSLGGNYTYFINYCYNRTMFEQVEKLTGQVEINIELIEDSIPPIIENVSVDKLIFELNESACVYADIIDNEGIKSVELEYNNQMDNYIVQMYNNSCEESKYSALIPLTVIGEYNFNNITASDYAENIAINFPNITIDIIHAIYGGGFNGTIFENPDDTCWLSGGDTWNANVVEFIGDSLEVIAFDDDWDLGNCPDEGYDYVQFDFNNLSVPEINLTSFEITLIHHEDRDDGILPSEVEAFANRTMFQCFNGANWRDMQIIPVSSLATTFTVTDISTCVRNAEIANNLSLRFTFDPVSSSSAYLFIDSITATILTKEFTLIDLWPDNSDDTRVGFNSLNSINNTFYVDTSTSFVTTNLLQNSEFTNLNSWTINGSVFNMTESASLNFTEGFESSNWDENWVVSEGSGDIERSDNEYTESYALSFSGFGSGEGSISHSFDFSSVISPTLEFYYALEDLESGDETFIDIYDGTWNNEILQLGPQNNGRTSSNPSDYYPESINFSSYNMTDNFTIVFRSSAAHVSYFNWWSDRDEFLLDKISLTSEGVKEFGLANFIIINDTFGSVNQNFTPTREAINITLGLTHSGTEDKFLGTTFAFCNLTTQTGKINVWNETWTSDIHNGTPVGELIDISNIINSTNFTYNIECGAIVGVNTTIAFDKIQVNITYMDSPTNDGWDWADAVYDDDGTYDSSFISHGDPSGLSDTTEPDQISVTIGGPNSGTTTGIASGAWGIEFVVSDDVWNKINSNNARALLSLDYSVIDLLPSTTGVGTGAVWVKSRITKDTTATYLGTNIDNDIESTFNYNDNTKEIWAAVDIQYPGWQTPAIRSYSEDISQYITSAGIYFIEFGGKVSWISGSKADDEGVKFTFDNIRLLVETK